MKIALSDLDKDQKAILDKVGLLLADLSADMIKASKAGQLDNADVWAIRTTMDIFDEMYDEMSEENQVVFEFLQDGPTSKLKKV